MTKIKEVARTNENVGGDIGWATVFNFAGGRFCADRAGRVYQDFGKKDGWVDVTSNDRVREFADIHWLR